MIRRNCELNHGTTVKITFINESKDTTMHHNIVFIQRGMAEKVASEGLKTGKENNYVPKIPEVLVNTKLLGAGEKTELIFASPPVGDYQFICTYPGHWQKMNGTFIVE